MIVIAYALLVVVAALYVAGCYYNYQIEKLIEQIRKDLVDRE